LAVLPEILSAGIATIYEEHYHDFYRAISLNGVKMDFAVAEVSIPSGMASAPVLTELKSLRGTKEESAKEKEEGGLRYKAIRQEGLRVGAQSGLAYRYGLIMQYLHKVEPKLNVTYSFNGFIKDGRLLVPAVVEVRNKFQLDPEKGEARVVRNAVTVEEEARIVSVVPTWRDYLWQEYSMPEMPHPSLLPRTDAESLAWSQAVDQGWKAGVSQADEIYSDRLAQLTKAVEGRHTYITLENKKMFSPASLRVVANKVTFNGRTMNVGETIYTVGNEAGYTPAKDWAPVWTR